MAKSSMAAVAIIGLILSMGALGGGAYMFFFHEEPVDPLVYGIMFVHSRYAESSAGFYEVDVNTYAGYGFDHNLTTNTLTILEEGRYDVSVCINFFGSDIDHYYGAYLFFNGTMENILTSQVRGTGAYATASVSGDIFFHAGDVIILHCYSSAPGFWIEGDDTERFTFVSLHKL